MSIEVEVPLSNISIINVPDGYTAQLVDIGPTKRVEIQGIATSLVQVEPNMIRGTIDASTLSPRIIEEGTEEENVHPGSNDGLVTFTVPTGISTVGQVYMEVILMNTGDQIQTTQE